MSDHMRQNLFFQKNATPDDLRIAWILNIFTVSGAWELAKHQPPLKDRFSAGEML